MNEQLFSWRLILLTSLIFITIFFLYELTPLDIWIQDHCYNFEVNEWLVDRHASKLKLIFYTGPKKIIIVFGVINLLLFILSFKKYSLKQFKWSFLYIALCLAIIPTVIASMKYVTNTYCPWDNERYGGSVPYVKVIEPYPDDFMQSSKGKCFPAAHPSGGFALFCLFFVSLKRIYKLSGLLFPFLLGWTMGIYQMLKGAHYLSHNLATFFIALILCSVIYKVMFSLRKVQNANTFS